MVSSGDTLGRQKLALLLSPFSGPKVNGTVLAVAAHAQSLLEHEPVAPEQRIRFGEIHESVGASRMAGLRSSQSPHQLVDRTVGRTTVHG